MLKAVLRPDAEVQALHRAEPIHDISFCEYQVVRNSVSVQVIYRSNGNGLSRAPASGGSYGCYLARSADLSACNGSRDGISGLTSLIKADLFSFFFLLRISMECILAETTQTLS